MQENKAGEARLRPYGISHVALHFERNAGGRSCARPGVHAMYLGRYGLCALALALALLACSACNKQAGHGAPGVQAQPSGPAQNGKGEADAGRPITDKQAYCLSGDYPHLAGLPKMEDLVGQDRRWGVPPLNQEAPFVPELPAYQGWCRCDTWDVSIALADPKLVLARFWNRLTAIDAATGAVLWQDPTMDFGCSDLVVIDGIICDQWGNYAAELATGKRLSVSAKMKSKLGDGIHPQSDAGWITAHKHRGGSDPPPPEYLAFLAKSGMRSMGLAASVSTSLPQRNGIRHNIRSTPSPPSRISCLLLI